MGGFPSVYSYGPKCHHVAFYTASPHRVNLQRDNNKVQEFLSIQSGHLNCPIDLKEAISSVIFASSRCVDVPELTDIRKHLTVKYGKEFITIAIELRRDCGVNCMLEKLSAKAPDGQTKLKILTAIAEEHSYCRRFRLRSKLFVYEASYSFMKRINQRTM
ncbi:hypothetical protein L484_027929 [Morus notabilis]|uniref:Uncharacterized protein n=1 Tax=Morus notabilis TaxID=981085 RepID=W9SHZ7_9ROSA|nr:hypothetical protein L484_027929 [Morus notabilis]